jgi:hypothetical protein
MNGLLVAAAPFSGLKISDTIPYLTFEGLSKKISPKKTHWQRGIFLKAMRPILHDRKKTVAGNH